MVTLSNRGLRNASLCLWGVLAFAASVSAEVTARIDRPSVDLNESFILEITADKNIDSEPDFTVLDETFYRGQVSKQSKTSIINNQMRRSRTWNIALMAKSTGKQEIPGIAVGNDKSLPITIMINEPIHAPPGEADVFVTSEVDQTEAYVQSQILYRFRVYRAVATRQQGRRDPLFTGAEVLVETVGDDRSYEAILNDKAYNVLERVLAIYPQSSGEISISPALFEGRVLRNGRITGRKVFESDSHTIKVLPVPPPPAEYPDAAWLPARDVQLSEEWSRESGEIAAGEPVTRKVTISALGQIETQLPALEPPIIDGMNVYEDKPDLSRIFEAEGIRGVRRDQYAMIGIRGGSVQVPQLEVPWWDTKTGEWRVARLPARTLEIEAPVSSEVPAATPEPETAPRETDDVETSLFADGFWRLLSQIIAAIWLLTVLAWWWSTRSYKREPGAPAPPPVYKQQAKFVKAARKAATAGDKASVRAALIEWGRLQWPNDAPRSLGDIALRVSSPLRDELQLLSATSYGAETGDWEGSALAKLLRSIDVLAVESESTVDNLLPPLMPPGV